MLCSCSVIVGQANLNYWRLFDSLWNRVLRYDRLFFLINHDGWHDDNLSKRRKKFSKMKIFSQRCAVAIATGDHFLLFRHEHRNPYLPSSYLLRCHHKQGLVHIYSMKTIHLHTILIITHILRAEPSEPSERPPPPTSEQDGVFAQLCSAHERAECYRCSWAMSRKTSRSARLIKSCSSLGSLGSLPTLPVARSLPSHCLRMSVIA